MERFRITGATPMIYFAYLILFKRAILLLFSSFLIIYLYTIFVTTTFGTTAFALQQTAQTPKTLYVAENGSNSATCGTVVMPCRSIQYAINRATSGDTILVAAGNYQYDKSVDSCSGQIGTTAVLCIYQKKLIIQGGYGVDDWAISDPTRYATIIDGQGEYRGVLVFSMTQDDQTSLVLDGFTIQNGRAEGITTRIHPDDVFAFGGGMLAENVESLHLKQIVFKANRAVGNTTRILYGGTGLGGGLAIRHAPDVTLDHIHFEGNEVIGGDGRERGGYAIGGGLYTMDAKLTGHHLTFVNNRAQAGNTTGSGQTDDGQRGHAYGAGASFQDGSNVTIAHLTARENRATGGNSERYAGGAFGGGIKVEKSIFKLSDANIEDNWVLGGNAENGWLGSGGGLALMDAETMLDRTSVINNVAQGGNGITGHVGMAQGGGVSASWRNPAYVSTLMITNSLIAGNVITMGKGITTGVGGGGGLLIQATTAQLNHVTIAANRLEGDVLQGSGILLSEFGSRIAEAEIYNSIVANHNSVQSAIHIRPDNQADFYTNLMAGNSNDINIEDISTVRGVDTISAVSNISFISSTGPDYDYRLTPFSPAIDAGTDSTLKIDRDGLPRQKFADLGAYEALPYRVEAIPIADGRVRVFLGGYSGIDIYQLTIICPEGANSPAEVGCSQSLDIMGTKSTFDLTGLSNYQEYQIVVAALDEAGIILATTQLTSAHVTNRFAYLPLMIQN